MSGQIGGHNDWSDPILNRLTVSSSQEDPLREQARLAESVGLQPQAVTQLPSTPRDGNSPGVARYANPTSSNPLPTRQDFSNEKVSKRETRLGLYYLGRTLGEGEFGKVKLGWKHGGNAQVAVKIIRKEKLQDNARMQKVFREVNILKGLEHPNIVRLHEMVETERTIGIVLEYAPCGELFNFILQQRYLKEAHAKKLFAQLVSAVGYLHKKGIVHRDLKLENLLLDRNHNIIVTDFGFANKFDPTDELGDAIEARLHDRGFVEQQRLGAMNAAGFRRGDLMATSCGSPCYAAPELVISDGLYTGRKVDVWSVGVILFAMLAGYLPYDDDPRNPDGDNINLLYSYISETELKFPDYVSPHARDLLKRILRPDPRKRADLFEVARHSWLSGFEDVVDAITSTITDATGMSLGSAAYGRVPLARSASAREASSPAQSTSPVGGLISKHGNVGQADSVRARPREAKRQTVQVEYVAPQAPHSAFVEDGSLGQQASPAQYSAGQNHYEQEDGQYEVNARKRVWEEQQLSQSQAVGLTQSSTIAPARATQTSMPPPSRPVRDAQRAASDSNALSMGNTYGRPATQGSMVGSRLPSRGSYGQPVAAQLAPTNAQGRFSQPRPPPASEASVGDSSVRDSDYQGQRVASGSTGVGVGSDTGKQRRGHTRSHTLSDLTQRVFGRSSSIKKVPEPVRQRPDRSHPPTSMKPVDSPTASRKSTDSRRSMRFGRQSQEFSGQQKRNSRRFSFIPRFRASSKDLSQQNTAGTSQPQPQSVTQNGNLDGASDDQQRSPQYSSKTYSPSSYQPPYAYGKFATGPYNLRAASAGNPTATQPSWPIPQQGQNFDQARTDSPATDLDGRKEAAGTWETESWSQSRKSHAGKTGPAQRVMDFFRGRRHERSGLA